MTMRPPVNRHGDGPGVVPPTGDKKRRTSGDRYIGFGLEFPRARPCQKGEVGVTGVEVVRCVCLYHKAGKGPFHGVVEKHGDPA